MECKGPKSSLLRRFEQQVKSRYLENNSSKKLSKKKKTQEDDSQKKSSSSFANDGAGKEFKKKDNCTIFRLQ